MEKRRRGYVLAASILWFLSSAAFGANRPFLYDRNELFEGSSDGEVWCAAAPAPEGKTAMPDNSLTPPQVAPDACIPEELKPWSEAPSAGLLLGPEDRV